MFDRTIFLDDLKVATPCPAEWNKMVGVRTIAMRDPEIPRVEDPHDAGDYRHVEPQQEKSTAIMGGIQLPPPTILVR